MEINTQNIKMVIYKDDVSLFKQLLDKGLNIDLIIENGKSLLIYSIGINSDNITKYLIENGADLDIRDDKGYTAAKYAAWRNDLDNLLLLTKHGADLDVVFDCDRWVVSNISFYAYICEYQPHYIPYIKNFVSDELKQKYKYLFNMEGAGLL